MTRSEVIKALAQGAAAGLTMGLVLVAYTYATSSPEFRCKHVGFEPNSTLFAKCVSILRGTEK